MKAKEYILRKSNKITAIQWNGNNCEDIALFMGHSILDFTTSMNDSTLKIGIMRIKINDYIIHNPSYSFFEHMADYEFTEKYKPIKNK